jgi:hypothetical protein
VITEFSDLHSQNLALFFPFSHFSLRRKQFVHPPTQVTQRENTTNPSVSPLFGEWHYRGVRASKMASEVPAPVSGSGAPKDYSTAILDVKKAPHRLIVDEPVNEEQQDNSVVAIQTQRLEDLVCALWCCVWREYLCFPEDLLCAVRRCV